MTDNYLIFNTSCNQISNSNSGIKIRRPWERTRTNCNFQNQNQKEYQMRKKAEILQYKNVAYNKTKSQKYALAVRNNLTNRTWVNNNNPNINNLNSFGKVTNVINGKLVISPKGLICNKNNSITTSYSYQCDVPGPVVQLKYDKTIPNLFRNIPLKTYKGSNNSWPQF